MHSIYKKEERGKEGGGRIIHKLCNCNITQLHTGSSLLSFSKSFLAMSHCSISLYAESVSLLPSRSTEGEQWLPPSASSACPDMGTCIHANCPVHGFLDAICESFRLKGILRCIAVVLQVFFCSNSDFDFSPKVLKHFPHFPTLFFSLKTILLATFLNQIFFLGQNNVYLGLGRVADVK